MRLAVTSDIHIDLNGPAVLDALAERVRTVAPDVLLLGGDIATGATTWLTTLLKLRPLVPHLLVLAGNHDVWSSKEAVARGIEALLALPQEREEPRKQKPAQRANFWLRPRLPAKA